MENVFVCYPRCSTCQRAKAYLEARGVAFTVRPIHEQNPSAEELRAWQSRSGLPLRRFFNTSGQKYRDLNLKERLPGMDEEAQLALLATDGMLVKRPILLLGDRVLIGFREDEWEEALG